WIRAGTTLLGAFLGRKTLSRTNLNKASTAIRGFGRSAKEAQDVDAAEDTLEARLAQKEELELELREEIDELHHRSAGTAEEIETFELKPRRADVDVRLVALAWLPHRASDGESLTGRSDR
ncbi:MAG: hypothetical protein MI919_33285, partial [Holophagales bacterium]|nr:hypothetical protein [Holophagales bacterium]